MNPKPVLMKQPICDSKYDLVIAEVLLIGRNPEYSHIRLSHERVSHIKVSCISTRHLVTDRDAI